MKFSSDPELEALIGRVCLVYARVEQEVGHVVSAAHGTWGEAMATDYLEYSSQSPLLLDWLKAVGRTYPEVSTDAEQLRVGLLGLKAQRDRWAHSSDLTDLFLLMKERGLSSMSDSDVEPGRLLNGKTSGHIDPPSKANVDNFVARASEVGDAATALASRVAALADDGIRSVPNPRKERPPSAR